MYKQRTGAKKKLTFFGGTPLTLHYMSLLFHNKNRNYIRMLNFESFMIDNVPDSVREFVHQNKMLSKEIKPIIKTRHKI